MCKTITMKEKKGCDFKRKKGEEHQRDWREEREGGNDVTFKYTHTHGNNASMKTQVLVWAYGHLP